MLGYPQNPVFYVLHERGAERPVKVGKDETWPSRFVQARCHTPRGMVAAAVFRPPNGKVSGLDAAVRRALGKHKRPVRAREWFDLSADQAIALLKDALPEFRLELEPRIDMRPEHRLYDDWRECRPHMDKYAWRIFLHEEDGTGRLKASYGALFDTHYLYCATYNWRPLFVVAGFESPLRAAGNRDVERAWRELIADPSLGRGSHAEEVGWLSKKATLAEVARFLRGRGLVGFPVNRLKPPDAPPKDATMGNRSIGIGQAPDLGWARPERLPEYV